MGADSFPPGREKRLTFHIYSAHCALCPNGAECDHTLAEPYKLKRHGPRVAFCRCHLVCLEAINVRMHAAL